MKRLVYYIALTLIVAQLIVVLTSWMLSATLTEGVRSLISAEGLRWFVGGFSHILLTPQLSWLLLGAMAAGCASRSGIAKLLRWPKDYRQQLAFRLTTALLLLSVAVVALLALAPHAVLLSATGHLWPSPFSDALIPLAALTTIVASAAYGLTVQRFSHVSDVFQSLIAGLSAAAPLLLLYIFFTQLFFSLCYVFYW